MLVAIDLNLALFVLSNHSIVMKYILIFFIAAAPLRVCSQTFSKSDIRPQAGESYLRHKADHPDSMNVENPGTGQTWDMSHVTHMAQNDRVFRVMNPSSTPNHLAGASFALMSYPQNDTLNKSFTYYRDTTNGYYELGDFQDLAQTEFTDHQFVYRFPLAFGGSAADDYCFDLTIFSTTYTYCGKAKLTFDGTGTLILKGLAPFQNVYRVKLETAMLKENANDSVYETIYEWYKPGIHHPLAQYTIYREPSGYSSRHGYIYSTSNTLSVTPPENIHVSVFPNPCRDELNVISDGEIQNLVITGITGNRVKETEDLNVKEYTVNTRDMAPGVYFLTIRGTAGTSVKKVLVGK